MLWVTRRTIRVNRTATAWLIKRFIDPRATFLFVAPEEVVLAQERDGAVGFDAPGATYPHQDDRGRCSFEALAEERCADDPALRELARIVHGADLPDEHPASESAGLRAISHGFPLVANHDQAVVEQATFLYDALYASLRERLTEGKR